MGRREQIGIPGVTQIYRDTDTQDIQEIQDSHETKERQTYRKDKTFMTHGVESSAIEELKLKPHLEGEIEKLREKLFDYRTLRVPVDFLLKVELESYLWAAVSQAAAIHESLVNDWKTPAWDFGRFAKTHPDLFDLDSGSALQRVKETIGAGFWSERLRMNPSDAEMAFDDIWNGCKSVPGRDLLTAAIA